MMKFNLASATSANYINELRDDAIVVDGQVYPHALTLAENHLASWQVSTVQSLSMQDFSEILALTPDIVVLGCGRTQAFPPLDIIAAFSQHGIGLEVMTTDAACRTYNVLRSEDRRVVAALLIQ